MSRKRVALLGVVVALALVAGTLPVLELWTVPLEEGGSELPQPARGARAAPEPAPTPAGERRAVDDTPRMHPLFTEVGASQASPPPSGSGPAPEAAGGSEGSPTELFRDGVLTQYHEGGGVAAQGGYDGRIKEGLWTYWDELGRKEMEGYYERGLADGHWRAWYPNGGARIDAYCRAGELDGFCRFWLEDGSLDESRTGNYEREVRLSR